MDHGGGVSKYIYIYTCMFFSFIRIQYYVFFIFFLFIINLVLSYESRIFDASGGITGLLCRQLHVRGELIYN